jgi:hypothetical protein
LLNGSSGFFRSGHFDEGKAARTARHSVFDHTCRFNRAGLGKQFLQIFAGGLEREVSNIKFCRHSVLLSPLYRTKKKLRIWVGFGETVVVEGPGSDALTKKSGF